MASKPAQKRLSKEYQLMQKGAPPFVWAAPDEKNILTWNYIIRGPPDSPYAGGEYWGVITFPPEYPFKPPGIKMITPSARFQPDKKICFSMSDFHPGTWNPAWSVATICTGILSFMLSDEITTGSMNSSDSDKKILAARSHAWNIKQKKFIEAFPDYKGETMTDLPNMGESDRKQGEASSAASPPTSSPGPSASATETPATAHHQPTDALNTQATPATEPSASWISSWLKVVKDRWPYAAMLVLAVMVSRMSG